LTEYTRPATWDDLKMLVRLLDDAGVAYALVGGYAVAAHGFNRFSEDIDILVDPALENSRRWILALSRLPYGATRELAAEPDVFASNRLHAIRVNDAFTVDVLPAVAGLSWEALKPHIIEMPVEETLVKVLDLEGLLKTKQGVRPRDQIDAAMLQAALAVRRKPPT